MENVFVIIIASYNLPAYSDLISLRRLQLQAYKIPYLFVIDGDNYSNPNSNPNSNPKPDELYIHRNPMIEFKSKVPGIYSNILFKYYEAVKRVLADPNNSNIKYIIRVNISTYINIKKLSEQLPLLPLSNAFMGVQECTHLEYPYLSGVLMMFSRDVMEYFAQLDLYRNRIAYDHWDDTAICWILGEKYKYTIPFTIHWHECWQIIDLDVDEAIKHPFVRVKNSSDRSRDVSDWFKLEKTLDMYKNLKN
jgi:hypothetical protein